MSHHTLNFKDVDSNDDRKATRLSKKLEVKMNKTVWVNGTERHIEEKDRYGMYHIFLDDKDIKWLNSIHFKNEKKKTIMHKKA